MTDYKIMPPDVDLIKLDDSLKEWNLEAGRYLSLNKKMRATLTLGIGVLIFIFLLLFDHIYSFQTILPRFKYTVIMFLVLTEALLAACFLKLKAKLDKMEEMPKMKEGVEYALLLVIASEFQLQEVQSLVSRHANMDEKCLESRLAMVDPKMASEFDRYNHSWFEFSIYSKKFPYSAQAWQGIFWQREVFLKPKNSLYVLPVMEMEKKEDFHIESKQKASFSNGIFYNKNLKIDVKIKDRQFTGFIAETDLEKYRSWKEDTG
ncbi:MAG: hypothetical protein ACLFQV_06330 [Vulcanimicrobiota bacterium]